MESPHKDSETEYVCVCVCEFDEQTQQSVNDVKTEPKVKK